MIFLHFMEDVWQTNTFPPYMKHPTVRTMPHTGVYRREQVRSRYFLKREAQGRTQTAKSVMHRLALPVTKPPDNRCCTHARGTASGKAVHRWWMASRVRGTPQRRTIEVCGLDVAHVVGEVAEEAQQVGGEVLVVVHLQDLAHLDLRPLDVLYRSCDISNE